jgi:hypothetical protein
MTTFRPKMAREGPFGTEIRLERGLNGTFLGVFHLPRVWMDVRLVEVASDPTVCSAGSCV